MAKSKAVLLLVSALIVSVFILGLSFAGYVDMPWNDTVLVYNGDDQDPGDQPGQDDVPGDEPGENPSPGDGTDKTGGNDNDGVPTIYTGQVLRVPGSPEPEHPLIVRRVDTEEKVAALTFDAGWITEPTPSLLDTLADYNVTATFFPKAKWIEDNPQLAMRIISAGHVVGNHSYTHPDMVTLTKQEVITEIDQAHQILSQSGVEPGLYRPPYGTYDQAVLDTIEEYGYRYVVMWTIDTTDWKEPGVEVIKNQIFDNIQLGSIILMHAGSFQTQV